MNKETIEEAAKLVNELRSSAKLLRSLHDGNGVNVPMSERLDNIANWIERHANAQTQPSASEEIDKVIVEGKPMLTGQFEIDPMDQTAVDSFLTNVCQLVEEARKKIRASRVYEPTLASDLAKLRALAAHFAAKAAEHKERGEPTEATRHYKYAEDLNAGLDSIARHLTALQIKSPDMHVAAEAYRTAWVSGYDAGRLGERR